MSDERRGGAAPFDAMLGVYARREPIVMLTAYDHPSARVVQAAGADVVLVGDSAAMTVLGYANTREISTDELIMLTRAVRRAITSIPMVGDLPFGSYEPSDGDAVASARRFVDEAGCDAVKLEGAGAMLPRVRAIVAAGIPVFGHVGLLPQSVTSPEGYRARGRDAVQALDIVADAIALADAGCIALIVEAVPRDVATLLTERVAIPVIGIGAGAGTDGQVLVYHDLLGLGEGRLPRFVRQYVNGRELLVEAAARWAADVRARRFPVDAETYGIAPEALADLRERLGRDG